MQESLAHYTSAYNNLVEEQKNKCDDNNEIVSLRASVKAKEIEVDDLTETVDRLKTEKSELEQEIKDLRWSYQDMDKLAKAKNEKIETLEKKVEQKSREIKLYRNKLIENQKKANFQDSKSLGLAKNFNKTFVKSICSNILRLLFKSQWLRFFIIGLLLGLAYSMIIMKSIENLVYSLGFGNIGILEESWAKYYTEKFRHSVAVDPYFACKSHTAV